MGVRLPPAILPGLAAAGLAVLGVLAAEPPQPAPAQPGEVVIGVRALTPDGQPVAGLEAADVEVRVDGRRVAVSAVRPQAPSATAVAGFPPRRLVVVVNRPSFAAGTGQQVLDEVAAFLERLPAAEYSAVWPIPAARPQLVLTGDRTITRAALVAATGTRSVAATARFPLSSSDAARIAAGDQLRLDAVAERECPQTGGNRDDVARCREALRQDALLQTEQAKADVQQTARELHLLVAALGRVAGLKHVVILTAGVGPLQEQTGAVRLIAADAAAAAVTVHAIQPAQLAGPRVDTRGAESSLEGTLARATGGTLFAGSDPRVGLRRLEQELAGEYAVVVRPEGALRDGQVHDLEVKTTRAGAGRLLAAGHIRLEPASGTTTVTAGPAATRAPASPAAAAAPAEPGPPPAGVPEAGGADAAAHAAMPLPALMARVADYVGRFEKTMSTVVLEERYVQLLKRWALPPKAADVKRLAWLPGDGSPARIDVNVYERRQTRSDLLLVQLPDQRWMAFRDVLELNGHEQRGREDRLRKLFVQQTDDSHRQLHRINQSSADLNLGPFYREINLPTVGLMVLHARYQARFSFRAGGMDRVDDATCRQITFTETAKPTVVRTRGERDVPLGGGACVGADGVVWRTRIELEGRETARGAIEVVYGPHERVDVLVPKTMWEWFGPLQRPAADEQIFIETMATYAGLRQFSVTTSEIVK